MRSASFNVGVLAALNRTRVKAPDGRFVPILDRIDAMAAASGGSYAASWYWMHHLVAGGDPRALDDYIFDLQGDEQIELRKNGALYPFLLDLVSVPLDLLLAPLNLFANGLFGWHLNTTPSRAIYEYRIRSAFHRVASGHRHLPTMSELRPAIDARAIPFPIVTATAWMDDDGHGFGTRLGNRVFEFTPLRYGSPAFDYNAPDDMPVARAVAVSGAALDNSVVGGTSQKTLTSALNIDLGYYIANYRVSDTDRRIHALLPFPLYFAHHYMRDTNGTAIYLTDGGHSDNLAAFALVRRSCRNIIVVDAEHDPRYLFEAYFLLKDALLAEMGVTLSVPAIDRCRDTRDCFDLRQPVLPGAIRDFPSESNDLVTWRPVNVAYMKLSANDDDAPSYPLPARREWERSKAECGDQPHQRKCFPQDPTTDRDFSQEQFEGYRDLGYGVVRTHVCQLTDALGMRGEECPAR